MLDADASFSTSTYPTWAPVLVFTLKATVGPWPTANGEAEEEEKDEDGDEEEDAGSLVG